MTDIADKYALHLGGGLGDMVQTYLTGYNGWKWLRPLKTRYPHIKTKLILTTFNAHAPSLFKYDPLIDEVILKPWEHPNHYLPKELWPRFPKKCRRMWEDRYNYAKGYELIDRQDALFKHLKLKPRPPAKFYLNTEDQKKFDRIVKKGPFIVVHPFASGPIRRVPNQQGYLKLIKRMITVLDHNVVVLGGNPNRKHHAIKKNLERFPFRHPRMLNLVGRTNLRVAFELVNHAKAFVGTCSCFFSAAHVRDLIPNVLFLPPRFQGNLVRAWRPIARKRKILWVEEGSEGTQKDREAVVSFLKTKLRGS